ncbi:hypothetical protein FRUB_06913 [Fimbriiglobus ruber]|uniref:Putative restriction endonuclease domain-containing protein n=1 Tax=Fimbriiglobus ruber TaxID=1908690 RepID=A0A225D9Z6_9BACT|nr:hypothetical protein FRUB_06913 [Fimbriiglobus ruber]
MPSARHGKICNWIGFYLTQYIVANDIGHILTNDSLFVIERDPDTVRGPDVCFVSYARQPKGTLPEGLLEVVPELVFEVRSPSDRWTAVLEKVLEYLAAGVLVVVVLDLKTESASVFRGEDRQDIIAAGEPLSFPDVLPGFSVLVEKLFA